MANHIQLDEGVSGKYTETEEVSSNVHRQAVKIAGVSACRLLKSYTVCEVVTCTNANTDYAVGTAMAAGTKYLVIFCPSNPVKVAMGATTSATNGVWVAAGTPTVFPVTVTGVAADDKCHVQSLIAAAYVTFTSMVD